MASPVTTTLPGTVTQVSNIESSTCGDGNPTLTEAFALVQHNVRAGLSAADKPAAHGRHEPLRF